VTWAATTALNYFLENDYFGTDFHAAVEIMTSVLRMRMQPEETLRPIVQGSFEPWIRTASNRDKARARRADCSDAGHEMRQARLALEHLVGRRPSGHSFFAETVCMPDQVKPGRPTPMP